MSANVLLVVFDTARADVFEPYGARRGSTPAVRDLASAPNGRSHPMMHSTASWTVPAHGSLFTGRLPRSAGFGHEGGGTPERFKQAMAVVGEQSLAPVLRRAEYATAGVSANPWVSGATGFDLGFDRFDLLKTDRNPKLASNARRDQVAWLVDALRARADDGAAAIERLLHDWLATRSRQPFFWFVNLMECHSPYLPPRPYSPFGPFGRVLAARDASRHCTLDAIWRVACGGWDIPDRALGRMRRMYDASIRQLDDWLARVLGHLDHAGVLEDTIVIVTSDHGENFGEGRRFGHAFSLDNRLLRVPFVSAGPLALDLPAVASLADVAPALLRALGVEAPELGEGSPVPGVAVAQLDAEGTPGDPRVDDALERWGLGDDARRILCESFACATDGRLKLVRRGEREEVFDLDEDPLEEHVVALTADVEARERTPLRALRAALDRAAEDEQRIDPAQAPAQAADADEVAALEEQLRMLGYL